LEDDLSQKSARRQMKMEAVQDHRSRVAAQRREKTRAKLLDSALLVFAEKGSTAVIDDVIAHAGMARGSFYNYFRTGEELIAAVAGEIGNELLRAIDPVVQLRKDPAERVACGARLLLHAVAKYPLVGTFLSKLPFPTTGSDFLGVIFVVRDLGIRIEGKSVVSIQQRVAADLVIGVIFSALHSLASEALDQDYPEAVVKAMLQGLGMKEEEAAGIVAQPLPEFMLDDTSILNRTLQIQRS